MPGEREISRHAVGLLAGRMDLRRSGEMSPLATGGGLSLLAALAGFCVGRAGRQAGRKHATQRTSRRPGSAGRFEESSSG